MAGGNKKIHEHPNAGKNGFDKRPNEAGRKPSIKKEIQELMLKDGQITIPAKQVKEIKENGDIVLKLPTQHAIAMKYLSWAMSNKNKGADMLAKLQEMIDGKATQPVGSENEDGDIVIKIEGLGG